MQRRDPAVGLALALVLVLAASATAHAQDGGGVQLSQYRAAPTARDGFTIGRPVGLGHLALGARLDADYAFEPLRVRSMLGEGPDDVLVSHQLVGQLGLAIGIFDRFVGSVRLPVSFLMTGPDDRLGSDPVPDAVALGDVALGARWVLFGERPDDVFAIALAAEATVPTAEAANNAQDLAGEAGPSFSPEIDAEVRFAPVHIGAELGLRFREGEPEGRVRVGNELFWGVGIGVDIVEALLDARLEAYGAASLDDFTDARRAPIELLLGARLHPGAGLVIGLGVGAGLGDGYGAPRARALLNLAWSTDLGTAPVAERGEGDGALAGETAVGEGTSTEHESLPSAGESGAVAETGSAAAHDARTAGTAGPTIPAGDYGNLDRDGDRIVDSLDQCPLDREDYDEIQDEDGCPEEDADADRIVDVSDRCPLTEGVANENAACNGCPALACVSDQGTITISERVEFATASDRILPGSTDVLTDVLSILTTSAQLRLVRIEGHTDDRGNDATNLTLSRARAASVRAWLVERGADLSRFEAWGCGEAHALLDNATRQGRQANRRVEFHIVDPPTAGYTPREGCERAE